MKYTEMIKGECKKYLDMGLSLVPAPYKSKGAIIKDWNNNPYTQYSQIEELLKQKEEINIGILTGEKNHLLVIDIDVIKNGKNEQTEDSMISYNKLQKIYGILPDTVTTISGSGGLHKYFRIPNGIKIKSKANFFGKEFLGIDIKCEGGKIMAPPSIHPNGNPYKWEKGHSITEIEIASLPEKWCKAMVEISNKESDNTNIKDVLAEKIKEGQRNETLYKFASALAHIIKDEEMILNIIKHINDDKCMPPLALKEIETIVKSACNNKDKKIKKEIEVFSADELWKTDLPDIQWIIPNFLGEGLSIIAGNPKTGKSWWALNLAAAVASGTNFLGMDIPEALNVLYLALEDGKYRLKTRLQMINELVQNKDKLLMSLDFGDMLHGGLENLEKFIVEKKLKLIIIDTWFKFRGIVHMGANTNAYEKDYCTLAKIKEIADKQHVCILLIHHMKKGKEDNIFLEMSGSAGYAGASDAMYILEQHDSFTKRLVFTGRDIIEGEMYITMDENCIYHYDNTEPEPTPFDTLSPEKRQIAEIFKNTGEQYNCKQIAHMTHKKEGTVRQHLSGLTQAGFLKKIKTGIYQYDPDNFYEQQCQK